VRRQGDSLDTNIRTFWSK